MTEVHHGLEGIVAFATEIAEPDKEGSALRYRGVDIEELVGSVPFEKVWGLLVDGDPQKGGDLIRYLALRSFHKPTCMRARPNSAVYERIGRQLRETNAAGLIVKSLKFCDHWYTERERMRRTFDLPVLVFDSDYAEGGRERLLSRVDAFVEMME